MTLTAETISDTEVLGEIIQFYREIVSVKICHSSMALDDATTNDGVLANVGRAFGVRLPSCLQNCGIAKADFQSYRYAPYGDLLGRNHRPLRDRRETKIFEDSDCTRRHALIYKAYRRHLFKKYFPRKRRWHLRRYSRETEAPNSFAEIDAPAAVIAFAMYHWEAAIQERFAIQGAGELAAPDHTRWDPVYHGSSSRYSVGLKTLRSFFSGLTPERGQLIRKRFERGPWTLMPIKDLDSRLVGALNVQRWVTDHYFVAEMVALFNESLILARRMVEIRRYWTEKYIFTHATVPEYVLTRHPRSGVLSLHIRNIDKETELISRVDKLNELSNLYPDTYRHYLSLIYR